MNKWAECKSQLMEVLLNNNTKGRKSNNENKLCRKQECLVCALSFTVLYNKFEQRRNNNQLVN